MLTLRRFKIPLLPLIFTLCGSCFNDSSESIGTGNNELGLSKIVIALKANKNPELMLSEKLELEEYLSAKLKRKVDVLIPTDSSIIVESFRNGTLDIGYLSSTDAVRNIEQSTASLFLVHLKNGNPFYQSVWLSLKDKPYNSILDLESLPVSFASRSSTSGFLIPVYDLVQRGLVGPNSSLDDFFSKTVYGTGYVSAVKKDPKTYEHIDPKLIGNHRNIIVSNQSGRSNILSRLEKYDVKIDSKDPKVQKILDEVKDREFSGYSYDGADASFELLANRLLGKVPEYLKVKSYDVNVSKENKIETKASVVFLIDGKEIECYGEGNGPVNALDNAIRKNVNKLSKYSEYLKDLRLVDYKVRILNTGTEAVTRVSIESTDSKGVNWFTIGVSPNIIDASFKALVDSLDYKLFKDKAPGSL